MFRHGSEYATNGFAPRGQEYGRGTNPQPVVSRLPMGLRWYEGVDLVKHDPERSWAGLTVIQGIVRSQSFSECLGVLVTETLVRFLFQVKRQRPGCLHPRDDVARNIRFANRTIQVGVGLSPQSIV